MSLGENLWFPSLLCPQQHHLPTKMAGLILKIDRGIDTNISYTLTVIRLSQINSNQCNFAKHISGFGINSIIDNISELMVYRDY